MVQTSLQTDGGFRVTLTELPPQVHEIPDEPLGPFGNVPVAYAIFRADLDESAERTNRSYYLHAGPEYCRLARCEAQDIIGKSHLEVVKSEHDHWGKDSYRAVKYGETANGIAYSPLTGGWVCYNISPSAIEGCYICAFVPVSDEQRGRQMSQDARTSKVISEMLSVLASENSFEVAMNEMLRMVYDITGADRVIVFECHGETTEITFERCAGGVEPQIGTVSPLSASVLNAWFKSAVDNPVALIPNAAILAQFSPALHEWCVNSGIESLMAAPFRNEGEIVGFLGAYNYHIDDSVDVNRVFSAISSFVGARIENRRLINSLEWAGKHDALTGLLNRRGASEALNAIIGEQPNAPFVLALIDLDDFKNTNDQYGHSAGDEALYTLGRFMTRAFPEDAILSRAGGDEFLVGMVGENADRADDLFANFASMPKNFEYEGAQLSISTSIGYAFRDEQAQTIAKVYTNADTALYVMKREGKAGVRKFSR